MNDDTRMANDEKLITTRLSRKRGVAAFSAMVISLLAGGCGGERGVAVEGTVTFAGQPVEEGAISFVPADGKGVSDGAVITSGKFLAMVLPGSKRVEIRASRPVPPNKHDPDSAGIREDFIPARFHETSTLTAEISADGENVLKFELK